MLDTVRIFIGSDVWQAECGAEGALRASIHDHTTGPVEITMMRGVPYLEREKYEVEEDYGWYVNNGVQAGAWNMGADPGEVYPDSGSRSGGGWATTFTLFRWAIPEAAGFEGYAIYQDADQLDIGDMRELLEMGKASPKPIYLAQGKSCVMVLDCAAFKDLKGWPSIAEMQIGKVTMYDLRAMLIEKNLVDSSLPRHWNFPDNYVPGHTKICHYTNARTQPSGAYEHRFGKRPHKSAPAVKLYQKYKARAEALGYA